MERIRAGFFISALGLPILVTALGGLPLIIFVAPVTIFATMAIGAPVYRCCRKHGWFRLWPFLLGGVAAGVVSALPFRLLYPNWVDMAPFAKVFAGFGAVHGTVFWLVAIWRNDELHALAPPVQVTEE